MHHTICLEIVNKAVTLKLPLTNVRTRGHHALFPSERISQPSQDRIHRVDQLIAQREINDMACSVDPCILRDDLQGRVLQKQRKIILVYWSTGLCWTNLEPTYIVRVWMTKTTNNQHFQSEMEKSKIRCAVNEVRYGIGFHSHTVTRRTTILGSQNKLNDCLKIA